MGPCHREGVRQKARLTRSYHSGFVGWSGGGGGDVDIHIATIVANGYDASDRHPRSCRMQTRESQPPDSGS